MNSNIKSAIFYVLLTAGCLFSLVNLYLILKYKFNLPMMDEWADYNPWRGLTHELTFRWIFSTTQNHPLVFQRLLTYFFQVANGRDFYAIAIIQYIVYSLVIFYTLLKLNKINIFHSFGVSLAFFNAGMVETFYWPFMAYTYWHLFFTGMSIWLILSARNSLIISGIILASFSFLQAGQGLGSNIALIATLIVLFYRFNANKIYVYGALYLAACEVLWFVFVPFDNRVEILNSPFSRNYFIFIANLILNGFNFTKEWLLVGLVILFGFLSFIAHLLYSTINRKKLNYDKVELFYIIYSILIFSSMGVMALGRDINSALSDERYHIYPLFFLVIFFSYIFYRLAKSNRWFNSVLPLNIVFALVYFYNSIDLSEKYLNQFNRSLSSLQCAREFFLKGVPQNCVNGPSKHMIDELVFEGAKAQKSSFCFTILDRANNPMKNEDCFNELLSNYANR